MICDQGNCEFIVSPNHPDFSNATGPPKTSNATKKKKSLRKSKLKRKRLSTFDVVEIIQSRKISNRLELMALAASWKGQGKNDLAEFVSNRGSKVVNDALETAKELSCAQERLIRSKKSRIELMNEHLKKSARKNAMARGYVLQMSFYRVMTYADQSSLQLCMKPVKRKREV